VWHVRAIIGAAFAGIIAVAAVAAPFSSLVIFGDSLSDVGNISQATADVYPGPYYFNGRFSNGQVYSESLSVGLGYGPMVRSTAGGNDFAYGGAQTSGTGGLNGLFIKDLDEQVSQFLISRTVNPQALFEVFTGANDFINGQSNVNVPVGTITAQISRLIAAGATQFFVPNLPLLGDTPRYNGNGATRTQYNTLTALFNTALSTALDNLAAQNSTLAIYRLDLAAMFEQARANPALFGLANVSDAAAPGLTPGTGSYNMSRIAANANQYLFWDDLHPTATVHAILAQRALALLALPGDYNHDGFVDAADYTVWRDGLGTAFKPSDYSIWKMHFGEVSGNGSLASDTVPETSTIALLVYAAAGSYLRRRRPSRRGRSRGQNIGLQSGGLQSSYTSTYSRSRSIRLCSTGV